LKAEDGTPLQPANPTFHVAYTAAIAARRKPRLGHALFADRRIQDLSEFTRNQVRKDQEGLPPLFKMIEDEFGTMPVRP